MSFLTLNRDELEKSENIFDVFLLLFLYCKENEGSILHRYSKDYKTFYKFQKDIEKFLTKKMKQSPALKVKGVIEDTAIKEYFVKGIGSRKKEEFILASLLTIDRLYKYQDIKSTHVLNWNFREYGDVYYLHNRSFGFDKFYKLIRGLDTVGDRIENRLNNISAVTKIATDYTVKFVELPSFVNYLLNKGFIRIAVVPFRKDDDEPEIETKREKDGQLYFCVQQGKDSNCLDRLEKMIGELEKINTDLIIFPELTFSEDLLDHLQLVLAEKYNRNPENPTIKLVVTGSLHVDGKNKCFMLRPDGKELFSQAKMNRFLFLPGEFQGTEEKVTEDIDISERVFNLFDSPFGRVATMICLDFLVPETYNILSSLKVNCFFLPSMTPSTERFKTNAFYHACASGAVTFFSNAYNLEIVGGQKKKDSFIFRPIKDTSDDSHFECLKRDPTAFETVLLFDSKDCKVQTLTLS